VQPALDAITEAPAFVMTRSEEFRTRLAATCA
jgi:hypothetical protein